VTTLTQRVRRRPLLLIAILGFAVVNLVTALSESYGVSLTARFFAGVFGGIVWSLLAGYAVRMSPAHLSGRAIAISGAGATISLVLGVPRSEEHTSELQSRENLVCRLLLDIKNQLMIVLL